MTIIKYCYFETVVVSFPYKKKERYQLLTRKFIGLPQNEVILYKFSKFNIKLENPSKDA